MTCNIQILHALQTLVASPDFHSFREILEKSHLADLAQCLAEFSPEDIKKLLVMLPGEDRAEVFSYLKMDDQIEIVPYFTRKQLVALFTHMPADERVDLFNLLPAAKQEQVMPALAQAEREDIRKLASYPEGTVGSVMTSDYATLSPDFTAKQAVEQLRLIAPDKETIYQSYVVDADHCLIGTVSLRQLITALPEVKVSKIMRSDVFFVYAHDAREKAAASISKYDVLAIPVIDDAEKLVGIVTHDDAMDVAAAEATEDFHKSGGSLSLAGISLKDAKVFFLYQKRILWLILLVFGNLFSGAGIAYFEDTITAYVALVFFLPLLIDSGGNAGSQSATLMVRALATGDVQMRDWGKMFGREFFVAILLGLTMALAVSALGILRGGLPIAFVVSTTMILVVITGSVIGMSLPFVLNKLNLDPATASAPLITSISDAVGVIIYFSVATAVLPMAG